MNSVGPPRYRCSFAWTKLVNSTVDDSFQDERGVKIEYSPSNEWSSGSQCFAENGGTCSVQPDVDQLYQHTWHESAFSSQPGENGNPNTLLNATMNFNGSALYVFCVLARTQKMPFGNTDMTFYIDRQVVGSYNKPAPANSTGYDYNVLVYANTSLTPGLHTFVLQNGHKNSSSISEAILDKIVYSYEDDSSMSNSSSNPLATSDANSSSTNLAAIVAPAVTVPLVAIALGLCICLYVRCRHRQRSFTETPINPLLTPYMVAQVPSAGLNSSSRIDSAYNSTLSANTPFHGGQPRSKHRDLLPTPKSSMRRTSPYDPNLPPAYDQIHVSAGSLSLS
ncbi:hypothetical protein D9758_006725 [Tetrapyrgos nigripes]|uniref:Uncharacterized protein n=1 Tax=Tetrapyrgos nigripes TaxID=182062 RepID=A0A8H5GJ18_9AGAR|nr:hypothetical protein D9758_006725 [Tetrapyrgos nigripes]